MSYNVKPSAPPLDINDYNNTRNEGETVDDLSNRRPNVINNNFQSVPQQMVSIPEQQVIYTPYQQQLPEQANATYSQANATYSQPSATAQQQFIYQVPPVAIYNQPNVPAQQQFVYQPRYTYGHPSAPLQQQLAYPYPTQKKDTPKYNPHLAKNKDISKYTYTSFPRSYPINRPPSPIPILRLPLSSQIVFTSKNGINCVCVHCYHHQKTRVKLKCSFISYFYCFILTIIGCCCIYPCIEDNHKDRYHYCSNCSKLLGHSSI